MKYEHDEWILRPVALDEREILSKPFYHASVDFLAVNGRVYLGEITITNGAGFDKIKPYSFVKEMGSLLKLPSANS